MPNASALRGSPFRTVLLALLLVSLVGTTPLVVSARAPPQAACIVCTDALDRVAADHGVVLERAHSEMVIRVHENTSTTWTARVTLARGADALRNASLRQTIVRQTLRGARMIAEPTDVTSHVSGSALVVSYHDPKAVERHVGVLVFTRFHATDPVLPFVSGGEGSPYLGADELELRAPRNYVVTGEYATATESRTTVRWDDSERRSHISRSTLVTFVDDAGPFTGVRTMVARWLC